MVNFFQKNKKIINKSYRPQTLEQLGKFLVMTTMRKNDEVKVNRKDRECEVCKRKSVPPDPINVLFKTKWTILIL